jgi:phosphatidylserine decarboxylase
MGIRVFDRASGEIYIEKQYGERKLHFLYHTAAGRVLLKLFIATRAYSKWNAVFANSRRSARKIRPFIDEYGIAAEDYEQREYRSFNDFFTRRLLDGKRTFPPEKDALISPADGKLRVFNIGPDTGVAVKNSIYTVEELIGDTASADRYSNGLCLVFRLTVDDHHRYCFIDDGEIAAHRTINGRLHTVGPISSKRYRVYSENHREVSLLRTENFGMVAHIEVGALLIGKITNREIVRFRRFEEKGYFAFGGSTVVLLLEHGAADIDRDILECSRKGMEVRVRMGERIGHGKREPIC